MKDIIHRGMRIKACFGYRFSHDRGIYLKKERKRKKRKERKEGRKKPRIFPTGVEPMTFRGNRLQCPSCYKELTGLNCMLNDKTGHQIFGIQLMRNK